MIFHHVVQCSVPACLCDRSHVSQSPPYINPEIRSSRFQDDTCSTSKLILYNLLTISFINNYSVKRSKMENSRKSPLPPHPIPAFFPVIASPLSSRSSFILVTGQCRSSVNFSIFVKSSASQHSYIAHNLPH